MNLQVEMDASLDLLACISNNRYYDPLVSLISLCHFLAIIGTVGNFVMQDVGRNMLNVH